jgi:hypothetical protein
VIDEPIISRLPGLGTVLGARLLGEIGAEVQRATKTSACAAEAMASASLRDQCG